MFMNLLRIFTKTTTMSLNDLMTFLALTRESPPGTCQEAMAQRLHPSPIANIE